MLIVNNGVVQAQGRVYPDMLNDTRCVVSSFIKMCKETGMPDEIIEQTCVQMIAKGFENLDKNRMFSLRKDEDED